MKFNIKRNTIFQAINTVNGIVEKRQTLPILSNIYIRLQNHNLTLIGTDLEAEMTQIIMEVNGSDCEFTVSSRTLLEIVRMLPESSLISFSLEKNKLVIKSGKSRYSLKTLDADAFPRITTENWDERIKISLHELKRIINKTSFSMAVQDVRYYLNGVLLTIEKNIVTATATDGHRLAISNSELLLSVNESRKIIIPRKAVLEISRFFELNADSEITLEIGRNHLKISNPHTILITKLIEGNYPDFSRILSLEFDLEFQVNRLAFIESLSRVAILTTDRTKTIRIDLDVNIMRISTSMSDLGEGVEEIEINYNGPTQVLGYNISYIIEAAKTIESEVINCFLNSDESALILKQPEDERSKWLVMPMKI